MQSVRRAHAHSERHQQPCAQGSDAHAIGQGCLVVFALLHVSVMKMIADTSVMKVSRPRRFVTRCGVRRGAVLHEYEKATNIT